MNQKTAKLLKQYAGKSNKTYVELKIWWNKLPWNLKEKERKIILAALKS